MLANARASPPVAASIMSVAYMTGQAKPTYFSARPIAVAAVFWRTADQASRSDAGGSGRNSLRGRSDTIISSRCSNSALIRRSSLPPRRFGTPFP